MKNKKTTRRRSVSGKLFVTLLATVLLVGCIVGGTVAWLVDKTDSVTNTFTYGDINITLEETTGDSYKIIPGMDIEKDPKVTVKADSEACWLFVKVDETGDFVAEKVSYAIADGWTALPDVDGVYYREVAATEADTVFDVLQDNKITVSDTLTKEDVEGVTTQPALTFTAYAVQKDGIADAAAAWAKVNP